jgi:hypothetical protein
MYCKICSVLNSIQHKIDGLQGINVITIYYNLTISKSAIDG